MIEEQTTLRGRRIGYNEGQRKRARVQKIKHNCANFRRWFKSYGWFVCILVVAAGVALWQSRFYLQRFNPLELRRLQYIEIEGNRMLSWEDVVQNAQVETGMLMSELDADSVKKALLRIPLIHSAEVERKFPSSLHIRIKEASPIASMLNGGSGTVFSERGLPLPMSRRTALHLPIVEQESVDKIKTISEFLTTMRNYDENLYGKVSQIGWNEKHNAYEVFFRDVGFCVLFPKSGWNKDLFMLYEALEIGFQKDLFCAGEVDMRFPGFAYIRNYDKRCING